MAEERTLTINLRDESDNPIRRADVTIRMVAGDRTDAQGAEPKRFISNQTLTDKTDHNGRVQFELIPTIHLVDRNKYIATIPGVGDIQFVMPDMDTSLEAILDSGSPDLPARQLPNPNGVPDGASPVSESNAWNTAIVLINVSATQPPNPPTGAGVIWIDTTRSPASWKYWNGTSWIELDLEAGQIVEAHLGDGQVTTIKIADNAITNPKLAPNAVNPDNLNADTPSQKDAFRTRLNAEEAGHSHTSGDNPHPDDSITPPMAQADLPAQKEAWRTRFDVKADIADWAETGNTDDVPVSKIPDLDASKITTGSLPIARIPAGDITDRELGDDVVGNSELKPEVTAQLVPGGGTTGQVLQKNSNADNDVGWSDEATAEDAATWAEEGNNDLIPEAKIPVLTQDKLPASVHSQFIREHSFDITTGVYTGAKGFNRVTGGGGSATNATWTSDANQLQLIAFDQTNDGFLEMLIVGVLPADFNDRIVEITDSTGYLFVLRVRDAIRTTPPTDTTYPAGLQTYTSFAWRGQSLTAIQDRDSGDVFTVSLGDTPEGYIDDEVEPWARTGHAGTIPDAEIPRLAGSKLIDHTLTSLQYGTGSVNQDALGASSVNAPKLDADTNREKENIRNRIGIPSPATDNDVNKYLQSQRTGPVGNQDDVVNWEWLDDDHIEIATDDVGKIPYGVDKGSGVNPRYGLDWIDRPSQSLRSEYFLRADNTWANPSAMGGAGGQSAAESRVQFVSLWKWSGTAPSTLELTGANLPTWGSNGWSNIPTGWTAPAAISGVGNRYRADTIATWNETTNSFDLSTWTITEETGFNVQYTPNPSAVPLVTTSNRTATSTHWRQRDPNTGHWPVIWNALYTGLANWTLLASVPIDVTSKTQAKIVTLTNPIRTRDFRFLGVQIDVRNPALNQTDISGSYILQPWNQIWPAASNDTTNNYISGASFVVFCGPAEIEVISSQGTLPGNVSAGASNYFGTKFKLRGNTATGEIQSIRFHEWAAINQSGYISFLYI